MKNTKALDKLYSLILETQEVPTWEQQKTIMKYIIEQHINNSYMIDQRYYKEYINLYHDMLTNLNEL
jgi:hypothetical protein